MFIKAKICNGQIWWHEKHPDVKYIISCLTDKTALYQNGNIFARIDSDQYMIYTLKIGPGNWHFKWNDKTHCKCYEGSDKILIKDCLNCSELKFKL